VCARADRARLGARGRDRRRTRARAKAVAVDLRYGAPLCQEVASRDGDYPDLAGANVVLVTAGVNEKSGGATDRNDPEGPLRLLDTNARVYRDMVPRIVEAAPEAVITNAPQAGIFTLMARTSPKRKGAGGISAFIVEAGTPGVSFGKRDRKMGQKGAHTCDVIFENCRVPAENLIGGVEGQGFKTAMKVLDKGRIHIAAICVAVAERMLADALRYATERSFGRSRDGTSGAGVNDLPHHPVPRWGRTH